MLTDLRYRLRAFFRRSHIERDLDDELRFHLDRQKDKYLASGMSPTEAARRVRLDFGTTDSIKDQCRDAWGVRALDETARNIRYAVRALRKRPGFTTIAVLTLGLGIGANSAVFSALNAVVLRPLPFPDAHQLLAIDQYEPHAARPWWGTYVAPARLEDWQRMTSAFQGITGSYLDDLTETSGEFPERISRAWVAPRFFEVFAVAPMIGRIFTSAEERFGGPPAVIVSERFWHRRFGSDDSIRAHTLRIGQRWVPIVGVMPATFAFPNTGVEVWSPSPADAPYAQNRQATWFSTIGRLRPGVTIAQGMDDLNQVQAALGQQYPATDASLAVRVTPLKTATLGATPKSLWMLFAAVSLLLLVVCTNIAALLLARNAERRREISIRYSLGASRAAVVRQLLTEAIGLALLGSALGLAIAVAGFEVFRALGAELPRMMDVRLDWTLVAYSLTCAVAASILFGLFPAIRTARSFATDAHSHQRTQTIATNRLQWTLVGIQVALSVTLLFGAGLLLRSFDRLVHVSLGFDPSQVMTFRMTGNWAETNDISALKRRVLTTLEALRATPGVAAAATSMAVPGAPFQFDTELRIVEAAADTNQKITARNRIVSSSYFAALGIPMNAGTDCATAAPERTALVNRAFEALYFAGRSALGSHVQEITAGPVAASATIIGVVGDAREQGPSEPSSATIYWCNSAPNPTPLFLVRTHAGAPAAIAATIRQRVHEIEPGRAVYELVSLEERLDDTLAENRLRTTLLTSFAVTAVALAAVGLYGTLSYIVSMRRREIGLRIAMGALRRTTVMRFLKQGLAVTAVGAVVGFWLSIALARGLVGMLYGVTPLDPPTFVVVLVIVIAIGALASVWPAVRAARVDPIQVLREE
ncbi:MAG TPA: ABC transporter permease [Vicinamibacterales bacterium]|jgi:putative ABC transport system permease protein|nr:ABC transporter permease [Vicinamibacterales bacterium]